MSSRVLLKPAQAAELRRLTEVAREARERLELAVAIIALGSDAPLVRDIHYELDVAEPFVEVRDQAPSEPAA